MSSKKTMSSEELLKHLLNKRMALRGLRLDSVMRHDENALNAINEETDKNEALINKVLSYLALEVVFNG